MTAKELRSVRALCGLALQDRDDLSKTQQTRTRPSKTAQSEKH
jgi:hypothetical protein